MVVAVRSDGPSNPTPKVATNIAIASVIAVFITPHPAGIDGSSPEKTSVRPERRHRRPLDDDIIDIEPSPITKLVRFKEEL